MEVIQLLGLNATYVSSADKSMGKRCEHCLKIGEGDYGTNKPVTYETLLQFGMMSLVPGVVVKKALLKLNIESWYYEREQTDYKVNMRINEEQFESEWTTWECKPKSTFFKEFEISLKDLNEGTVMLDITTLVRRWLSKEIPNYGITLTTREHEFLMSMFSDYTKCAPLLILYCEGAVNPCVLKESIALQVQAVNKQATVTKDNENIAFDTICKQISDKIGYDFETNQIIVKEKGNYLVEWWVAIDGSGDITQIRFVLENKLGTISTESSAPVFVLTQPTGNAIIQVAEVPERLQLVNKSGAAIQFANVTVQASLVIAQI